ncbi:unnamed protein product, partial [Schistocephalus solidus]|uniref:TRP domain-containing protein n=1 Tax=Schistocephalus solidus TaxID=70667 RepID=A0A183S9Z5_SCHSO
DDDDDDDEDDDDDDGGGGGGGGGGGDDDDDVDDNDGTLVNAYQQLACSKDGQANKARLTTPPSCIHVLGFKMACALFSSVLTTGISSALAMPGMQATLSDAGEDCDYHRQAALPTVTNFLRQTYIAVQELAFNWEKYPYDHEFTVRMFTDGLPGLYEVGLILALTFSFIIFRIIVDPILRTPDRPIYECYLRVLSSHLIIALAVVLPFYVTLF